MTDVIHQAAKLEQLQRDQALRKALRKPTEPQEIDEFGNYYCNDCGVVIPPAPHHCSPHPPVAVSTARASASKKENTVFDDLNYSGAKFWLDAAQVGFTALIGLYVWLSKGPKESKKAVEDLSKRVDQSEQKIAAIELRLEYVPTQDEFHKS